jgi:SHS2 domain-containing protein
MGCSLKNILTFHNHLYGMNSMNNNNADYLLLDHTADLGIEIHGSDPVALFKKAGIALLHLIFGDIGPNGTDVIKISVSGEDFSDLMVKWLTEILYLYEGDHLVITEIIIDSLSPTAIAATLNFSPYTPSQHEILREIKAVTYHQIEVTEKNGAWKSRVIFDL